jgi:ribosomal protein S18 acetylase RimI-like enzyme
MEIRYATAHDLPFLEEMLFEAFFWRSETVRPEFRDFIKEPQFRMLVSGWGRPGDTAVIAQEAGASIGAAWYRFWTEQNHSYGFFDSDTPEIGMAVVAAYRSKGVGRALLKALIHRAQVQRVAALSLSVDPSNHARRLYASEGFVKVGESGSSWTYLLRLADVGKGEKMGME